MKYVKVTAFVDGEAVTEPSVPLFCLGFVRWVARLTGATLSVSHIQDTKTDAAMKKEPQQ